ncbi:GIY-YIG nuclease family protein [Parasynechococcus sp.]|uniref:GIY-YIG nuclease family protein n=1 Tax=Parasynechococcus sp. TaxID=3101203 RepID=UPI00370495A7
MQGNLFHGEALATSAPAELPLQPAQLQAWQQRIHSHQADLFRGEHRADDQGDLFASPPPNPTVTLDPMALTPLPLTFWRWPTSPHQGAAIYLVLDRPSDLDQPLLLYVGETGAADRRWKGDHDCKAYLAAYGESLQRCGLESQLSIRFCTDVPSDTRARRRLEQHLIQRWQPPFNKETRQRWATPFHVET